MEVQAEPTGRTCGSCNALHQGGWRHRIHVTNKRTFSSDDFFSDGFSSDAAESSLSADFFFSDFVFFVLQPVTLVVSARCAAFPLAKAQCSTPRI